MRFPEVIETEADLDEIMTRPRPALVEFVKTLSSPLVILGAGGKMGPTLAILARRAADAAGHNLKIVAVSRFSDERARRPLEDYRIDTQSCDLMNRESLSELPDSENIIYLVGLKFGTANNPAVTWATNTLAPAVAAERYRDSKIVALSSGNVYPLVSIDGDGSSESDPLMPLGEYANSCVARERIFEYYSRKNGTPLSLIRLSYALDLRYGTLVDIAQKVYSGQPVDVTMGYINCIWQGDANEMIIRSLALVESPPRAINLTGTEWLSVRQLALRFGELMGCDVHLTGSESSTALLSSTARMRKNLGEPFTPLDRVIQWTARWVMNGGRLLNKPTHFETRDGEY
jgi:nucleoside-diphosphate-sugar epimerase